ncbi:MAG TPA: hypothetical protein DC049_02380 [Spirochaetia bacterium]|nr:hypothetical protein [Spirochaetia bacterium]
MQGKLIKEMGTAPVLLRRIRGELLFAYNTAPYISAIMLDGTLKDIKGIMIKSENKIQYITYRWVLKIHHGIGLDSNKS